MKAKNDNTSQTAVIIGPAACCRRVVQQLDLTPHPPRVLGWIITDQQTDDDGDIVLGHADDLESLAASIAPTLALVTAPATASSLVTSLRTRLRRLGIADRFVPTIEDLIDGIGPRTELEVDVTSLIERPARPVDEEAIARVVKGKRVLITGAGGSIGSEIARLVARFEPAHLLCMDRSENALFDIDRQLARQAPGVRRAAILHDVVDASMTLHHCVQYQPQVIFHAAAHKHVPMMEDHPKAAVENNLMGTKAIADAAHLVQAERFVMISTDKAVNPSSIMGATKRMAELYVQHLNRQSQTGFTMVRFGNVLGSNGSVLRTWADQIADGGPITVTDPRMTRYFMSIPEAASLVVQAASLLDNNSDAAELYLLDMGEPISILELVKRFITAHGLTPRVQDEAATFEPSTSTIDVVFTGARPGEKLHEELAFDAEQMQPTRHEAIHIWSLPTPDEAMIDRMLTDAASITFQHGARHVAKVIRNLIPEMCPAAEI